MGRWNGLEEVAGDRGRGSFSSTATQLTVSSSHME